MLSDLGTAFLQFQKKHFSRKNPPDKSDIKKLESFCQNTQEEFQVSFQKSFPEDLRLSSSQEENVDFQWFLKPLDGYRNFIHGNSHFCLLLALYFRSEPVAALVYVPFSRDAYHAISGMGSFKNYQRLQVSQITELSQALIASSLPERVGDSSYFWKRGEYKPALQEILSHISVFISSGAGLRRSGSSALDICCIAEGIYDAFWELCTSFEDLKRCYLNPE